MTSGEPRRALLDTSVVIDFPAAQVAQVADEVAVSAVTIGELHSGVAAAAAARHGLTLLTRNGSDFTGLESALAVVDLPDQPYGTGGHET